MRVEHPAFFEAEGQRGSATLVEVSYSGARLEAEGAQLVVGEPVLLYLWPASQAEPFPIRARVAGLRTDGFAVEYQERGQEVCQWVDALQAAAGATPAPELRRTGSGR